MEDLAVAMANVIGREGITNGKVYNVQNSQAVTFDGVARIAAKVAGKEAEIIHFNPKDFSFPEGKKVGQMFARGEYTPKRFLILIISFLFRLFQCAPSTFSQESTRR